MKIESVLVTGTSSGLGRALLDLYTKSGVRVISVNHRRVPELEALYPLARFECVDVRSGDEVERLVLSLAQAEELPDVFILNAGINRVDNDESFDLSSYKSVIETNLYGVLHFIQPLTQLGRGRAARHLVAISSMANYVGNPYALGYTTSKQALTTCFEAWSRMYAETDSIFQRVMLGPVPTSIYTMHDSFPAWMVWVKSLCSAPLDAAARAVSRFAGTRKKRLFYPWRALPLYLAMWLCQSLVPGFFQGRKTLAGRARRAAMLGHDEANDE